jgi:hypothetical protein
MMRIILCLEKLFYHKKIHAKAIRRQKIFVAIKNVKTKILLFAKFNNVNA